MLASTPFLVAARIFGPLLVLIAVYLFAFGEPGGHQAAMEDLVTPYVNELMAQLQGLGGRAGAYVAPIAEAKFSSGRAMLGSTFDLSGGGFIRP
jgi:hypothetical protein